MVGVETSKEQLKAVYFAAGMAAFMSCIERAVVVSAFVHWHVWVFLVLNLLLLAILLTSKLQIPSVAAYQEKDAEFDGMKTREEKDPPVLTEVGNPVVVMQEHTGVDNVININKTSKEGVRKEDNELLSNGELNQRVEAFIAMFRQHLVSDATKQCPIKPALHLGHQFDHDRECNDKPRVEHYWNDKASQVVIFLQ